MNLFKKYICFENKWEIDINAILMMWCSTKNWTDTIWRFWTWLKYAIAVLIRNWIDIKIFKWEKLLKIETKKIFVKNTPFNQIIIDWKDTWFTTNLWVDWKVWHWVREFYANALDEWWKKVNWNWNPKWKSWETRIFIENKDEVKEIMGNFLFDWWVKVEEWLFYKKKAWKSPLKVYKQWFLIYDWWKADQTLYDYRIDDIKINEMRMCEDRRSMQYQIWKIQAKFDYFNLKQLIDNWNTDIWIFWDSFEFNEDWGKISIDYYEKKVKNYWLLDCLKKNQSKNNTSYWYWYSCSSRWNLDYIKIELLEEIKIDKNEIKIYSSAFEKDKKFDIILKKNNFSYKEYELLINQKYIDKKDVYIKAWKEFIKNNNKETIDFLFELLIKKYDK